MAMLTADQVAQKWAKNLGASTTAIQQGVNAVTVSPMDKAAANVNGYITGVQNAVASGKWVRGLRRRTLQDWQNAMTTKGVARIAQGAQTAIPQMTNFMSQWLPYMQQLQNKLASMPRGDIEQNKQRLLATVDFNHAFVRQ